MFTTQKPAHLTIKIKPCTIFLSLDLRLDQKKKHGAHPTQKPLALLDFLISTLSNKGDVVLDPFMGSGSTGVSSAKLQRDFIGIELEKDYFQVAKKNIESEKQCQLEL